MPEYRVGPAFLLGFKKYTPVYISMKIPLKKRFYGASRCGDTQPASAAMASS